VSNNLFESKWLRGCFKAIKTIFGLLVGLYLAVLICFFAWLVVAKDAEPLKAADITFEVLVWSPIEMFIIPVTSDDDMISFLNQHRADFEEIINIHQKKCLLDPVTHKKRLEVTRIMQRIGVARVSESGSNPTNVLWVEHPYSEEAAESVKVLRNIPYPRRHLCPYRSLDIGWKPSWLQYSYRWGLLDKVWIYFPVPPRVDKQQIYFPNHLEPGNTPTRPILESLDRLPKKSWRKLRQTLFRQIDEHWFLAVKPKAP
jgi:hypothetical protein